MNQHDLPTLDELDRDGAVREAASRIDGHSRAAFLRRTGAFVGGSLLAAGLVPNVALAASNSDVAILNYALTLEYLEAAFYKEAMAKGALSGETKRFAQVVVDHESAHVDALRQTLGSKAVKKPAFDFKGTTGDQTTFQKTAMVLEDTGVKAYLGQAGKIKASAVLKAAASILAVEARHAAWIANIIGGRPAPASFQPAATMDEVLQAVKGTGFLSGASSASPASAVSAQPRMTG